MPDETPGIQLETPSEAPAPAPEVETPAFVGLPPDAIRNSPEYRELARQNRTLARQKGDAERQLADERTRAAAVAQAAEAQQVAAQEAAVRRILGDDGVAVWDQFADLSATDPIGAAELLAQFVEGRKAQSPAPAAKPAATDQAEEPEVPQQPAARPATPATGLSRSVGDAPLAGNTDDTQQVIEGLEKRFADIVERNQDPARRNRVTMRDRAEGVISYLGAAYLKAGARPGSKS